jgi:hypothetical protein
VGRLHHFSLLDWYLLVAVLGQLETLLVPLMEVMAVLVVAVVVITGFKELEGQEIHLALLRLKEIMVVRQLTQVLETMEAAAVVEPEGLDLLEQQRQAVTEVRRKLQQSLAQRFITQAAAAGVHITAVLVD